MARKFGKFEQTIVTDKLRPVFGSAMIKDGAIWTTDTHCIVKSNLSLWTCVDKDSIGEAEGKLLSTACLKAMSGSTVNKITFDFDQVIIQDKKGADLSVHYYFGLVEDAARNRFGLINPRNGDLIGDAVHFPNVEGVIPRGWYDKDSEILLRDITLSARIVSNIQECFCDPMGFPEMVHQGVRIITASDGPKHPYLILPSFVKYGSDGYLDQFGICMPVTALN